MLDVGNPKQPVVVLGGLSSRDLSALERANLSREAWTSLLRVTVKTDGRAASAAIPVTGSYAIANGSVRFTPMFPLDPGRQYDVVFDPAALPEAGLGDMPKVSNVVATPPAPATPPTRITAIYPSGPTVPSNLLRMYVEFSGPMGTRTGQDYIRIADGKGADIPGALLPLDTDLWNSDRTRFTVLFDPGRVKRGILPNRMMGRPLKPGMTFTLAVRREWPDAHGKPLVSEFRKDYRVGPPVERALATSDWRVAPPAAGSRDPLVVTFRAPMDRGLAQRALTVVRGDAEIAGEVRVEAAETEWRFTPNEPWQAGDHAISVLPVLEDVSGNRIGTAFETLTPDTAPPGPSRVTFQIR
jgi:hypothetical protein